MRTTDTICIDGPGSCRARHVVEHNKSRVAPTNQFRGSSWAMGPSPRWVEATRDEACTRPLLLRTHEKSSAMTIAMFTGRLQQ